MLISLLLAILFWIFFRFLQTQEVVYNLPVTITNLPTGMSSPRLIQKSIPYLIRGKVFDLLLLKNSEISVELDMKYYDSESKSIPWEYFRVDLPKRFDVEEITPYPEKDFFIETDMLTSRNVPVKLVFDNEEVKAYFTEKGFSYTPKLVELTGVESVLDKIERLNTVPVTNEHLMSDFATVQLILPLENVIVSVKEISITKPERDIISKTFSLVPVVTNVKQSSVPRWISVRVIGPKALMDTLSVEHLVVKPDSLVQKDGLRKLMLEFPSELMLLEYSPEKVQIIERK